LPSGPGQGRAARERIARRASGRGACTGRRAVRVPRAVQPEAGSVEPRLAQQGGEQLGQGARHDALPIRAAGDGIVRSRVRDTKRLDEVSRDRDRATSPAPRRVPVPFATTARALASSVPLHHRARRPSSCPFPEDR
jgi:hypothetical protein